MFRDGPARLGRTSHVIPTEKPHLRWRFSAGRAISGSPIVADDGAVLFTSLDGFVYCLERAGRLRWKRRVGARASASVAVLSQRVYVGSDDDWMLGLDLKTGRPLWRFRLGPCADETTPGREAVRCDADSSPAISGKTLYFGGDALYALTLSGALEWRFALSAHAASSPAVADGQTVFIGTQAGSVRAVRGGKLLWTFKARWHCDGTPAWHDGRVIVGCDDRRVYGLSGRTGDKTWEVITRGAVRSSPAVAQDGTIYVGSYDRKLYAIKKDGSVAWTFATRGAIHSSPTVDRVGNLVFGSRDHHVYAINAQGKELWRLDLGADVDASVHVSQGGALHVGTDDGVLFAY